MRIVLISQFFAPDITAAAFRLTDFAGLLAQNGHQVVVLTSYPHKAYAKAGAEPVVHRGLRIYRCRVKPVTATGSQAYLTHYLSFVRGSLARGVQLWLSGWQPDVIYASSPPLLVGVTARILSLLFRCPFVFEVRDIWPDSAVAAGQLSPQGPAYRVGRCLERYLYEKSTHIVCVARPMRDYLVCHTGTPVTIVYNGVRDSDVQCAQAASRPESAGPPTRTILFAGNLGHVQQLDLLVDAAHQLRRAGCLHDWRLCLLGQGAQRAQLQIQIDRLAAADYITIEGPVDRNTALARMASADLLYLSLKDSPSLSKTIPSKLFDYLLAARPIVAGLAGEGRELLVATGANVCHPPGDLPAARQALSQATTHLAELNQHAHRNRELVLNHFTRSQSVKRLLEVFERVTGRRQRGRASPMLHAAPDAITRARAKG